MSLFAFKSSVVATIAGCLKGGGNLVSTKVECFCTTFTFSLSSTNEQRASSASTCVEMVRVSNNEHFIQDSQPWKGRSWDMF